jgi:hypothetical protein
LFLYISSFLSLFISSFIHFFPSLYLSLFLFNISSFFSLSLYLSLSFFSFFLSTFFPYLFLCSLLPVFFLPFFVYSFLSSFVCLFKERQYLEIYFTRITLREPLVVPSGSSGSSGVNWHQVLLETAFDANVTSRCVLTGNSWTVCGCQQVWEKA